MNDNINLISNDLQIDPGVQANLSETARWAKFIAVAGFIFSGMIVIFALFYMSVLNSRSYGRYGSSYSSGLAGAMMVYIVIGIVWCVTSVYQFRFASKVQSAIQDSNQEDLDHAFRNLKIYYRICGVITIISLGLSALGLIGIMASFS
jgi:hypothetical protein